MKEFNLDHVFMLSEIVEKMEIQTEAEKVMQVIKTKTLNNSKDAAQLGKEIIVALGLDISLKMFSVMHKARKEVIALVSDLSDKPEDEVRKMKLKELVKFLKEVFAKEGIEDFFDSAE